MTGGAPFAATWCLEIGILNDGETTMRCRAGTDGGVRPLGLS